MFRVEVPGRCSATALLQRLHRLKPEEPRAFADGIGIVQLTDWGWGRIQNLSDADSNRDCWVVFSDAYLSALPAPTPEVVSNIIQLDERRARFIATTESASSLPSSGSQSGRQTGRHIREQKRRVAASAAFEFVCCSGVAILLASLFFLLSRNPEATKLMAISEWPHILLIVSSLILAHQTLHQVGPSCFYDRPRNIFVIRGCVRRVGPNAGTIRSVRGARPPMQLPRRQSTRQVLCDDN
jgi:hypothetical protein